MFFITNDKTKINIRKKDRRPCPQNNFQFPRFYFIPNFDPFVLREFRVINTDMSSKMFLQSPNDLGSQSNFRQHVQHLLSLSNKLFDQFYVYLCFSTGSNAMQ